MTDSRHIQLSRIYRCPIPDDATARDAIEADPGCLASAIFLEAAESDDVNSIASARSYFEDRLEFFGPLAQSAAVPLRDVFEARLAAWA